MIIIGQHRSEALARKHLLALRRQYRDAVVEIISRRNAKGHYSGRGQFFWYEVTKIPTEKLELVAHFDYAGGKSRDLLRFQVHIIAPKGTTDNEALEAIREHFENEEPYPRGWKEKVIKWGHTRDEAADVEKEYDSDDARQSHLAMLAILGSSRKISRRTPIKTRRSARRKAKKR